MGTRSKTLKLFNGRGQSRRLASGHWEETGHIYIAANSKSDAVRLMKAAGFQWFTYHELTEYFSPDCWGNDMDSVTPERGVWAHKTSRDDHQKGIVPRRLI